MMIMNTLNSILWGHTTLTVFKFIVVSLISYTRVLCILFRKCFIHTKTKPLAKYIAYIKLPLGQNLVEMFLLSSL